MGVSRWLGVLLTASLGVGCQCFVPVDEDGGALEPDRFLPQPDSGAGRDAGGPLDGGAGDSGVLDAGFADAGALDASFPDAGAPDSGSADAGTPDAGVFDAGPGDSGPPDVPEAGPPDAGPVRTPLGSYDLDFLCTSSCTGNFRHRLSISTWDPATGNLSGSGYYAGDPRYTWSMVGQSSPPNVQMTLTYTGLNPGYQTAMTGLTDQSGAPAMGTATTTQGQTLSWATTRLP